MSNPQFQKEWEENYCLNKTIGQYSVFIRCHRGKAM